MNIAELLTDYKKQAIVCSLVNYADKASVRKNNRAVNKMYAIVDAMVEEYGSNAPESFKESLDISDTKSTYGPRCNY